MASSGTSFRKGQSGNPAGKRQGSRNRVSKSLDELLDGEGEAIVRKAVELANEGEPVALRLVLDRLIPPRRERRISVDLPPIETAADAVKAAAAIVARVASGELTMSEGESLTKLVDNVASTLATSDLADRVARLEAAQNGTGAHE